MKEDDQDYIRDCIERLKLEHRDLDDVIALLSNDPNTDQIQLRRFKKRKLLVKDQITRMESSLIPDLEG